jgi:hypothetical protein
MARRRIRPGRARVAKPKFYLDEVVGVWVADVLGRHHHVDTAESARLLGRSDADHSAYCWRRGKVLVTHDMDFWNYKNPELSDTRNPGIVVFGCGSGETERILSMIPVLESLSTLIGEAGWRDTRIVLGKNGAVRIRRRNRRTGDYVIEEYRLNASGLFRKMG